MSAVYFIRCGTEGPIKIGKAKNVAHRRNLLQIGCPDELHILGTLDHHSEADLHVRFAHSRRRGEWFDATPELLAFIAAEATIPTAPTIAPVDMDSPRSIIRTLGGITATARLLDLAPTTVNEWEKKDRMPRYRRRELIEALAQVAA